MGLLIRNGTIVTADREWRSDIRCADGRIVEIGESLESAGEKTVDASAQYVFPGGIDPHVHMELPVAGTVSSDDFETGTAAAIAGGTTTILDFVHPERGENFLEALAARRAEAAKAVCDYGLHMAITWWGEETAQWMVSSIDEGVPSFKIYMAYKQTVGLDDADIVEVLQTLEGLEGLLLVHAEHGEMIEQLRNRFAKEGKIEPRYHALSRPSALEGEATNRIATLAGISGVPIYVVHVTCREAAEAVSRAREKGWPVHGETCPQYLLLEDSVYDKPEFEGAAYVIAPPIRPQGHQQVLWSALAEGTLEAVGTDHCPFHFEGQKELGRDDFRLIPGGAAGVEHRLTLLYSYGVAKGVIDRHRFVDLVSTRPARFFGLYPRKGAIAVGSDADLVVWDPEATGTISARTHHHRCDRSIFEGFELEGLPSTVIAAGQVRYQDGDLQVERGAGRFLPRALKPSGPQVPKPSSPQAPRGGGAGGE
jgi:dihydropyrimidinase